MPKENVQKEEQRSTKHTYKTKDRVTRTPLKTWSELRCSGTVGSSCSTSGTLAFSRYAQSQKIGKTKINKSFRASFIKGLSKLANIGKGYLCLREIFLSFNKLHYLCKFPTLIYLINQVSAVALVTGWRIPLETNSLPAAHCKIWNCPW